MVGVEVSGRDPCASNAPAPVLTILVSKRSWSCPANAQSPVVVVHFFIWMLVSLYIPKSGSWSVAAAAGLRAATASSTTRVAAATAQSKTTARFLPDTPTIASLLLLLRERDRKWPHPPTITLRNIAA